MVLPASIAASAASSAAVPDEANRTTSASGYVATAIRPSAPLAVAPTGAPRRRENGAVDYPWHGWEAGTDTVPGQAYDVVAAFEITAPFADVLA